jgi:UDP-glucose:(heptosyl)LPS alpha-1,3-glucosyltransferase
MNASIRLIAESLDSRRGGAEKYLTNLAGSFAQAGHPVLAWVRRADTGQLATGVEIEVVPSGRGSGLFREWQFARWIRRRLVGTNSVVFSTVPLPIGGITHYLSPSGLYRANFEAERASFDPGLRQRLFQLGNRMNFRRQWLQRMQERLLTCESRPRILTFSRALRTQILEQFQVPPAAVTRAPLGVNLTCFRPGKESAQRWGVDSAAGRFVLLFVGHNFRLKGLHCLLQALSRAAQRGLRAVLLVASSGSRAPFERLAQKLGVAEQVRFLGPVADKEMGGLYRASDVLVHPTFADHCSLVVLEALACGLPVVTTRLNGAAEMMESEQQGLILNDPGDIETLTEALLRLQNRQTLAKMSAAAVAIRPRLDFAEHARQVLAWLTES